MVDVNESQRWERGRSLYIVNLERMSAIYKGLNLNIERIICHVTGNYVCWFAPAHRRLRW